MNTKKSLKKDLKKVAVSSASNRSCGHPYYNGGTDIILDYEWLLNSKSHAFNEKHDYLNNRGWEI